MVSLLTKYKKFNYLRNVLYRLIHIYYIHNTEYMDLFSTDVIDLFKNKLKLSDLTECFLLKIPQPSCPYFLP